MTEPNPADVLADVSYSLAQPTHPTICINANDGRALLTIKPDGTVEGEIENASEAARVFVESIRGYLRQPTQTDALREALALARNRLQRVALELPHDSRSRIECNEWADEATSALEVNNG